MTDTNQQIWERFQKYFFEFRDAGLCVDISKMHFNDSQFADFESKLAPAWTAMSALEKGEVANPDEKRMVGHYWLRNPSLAPSPDLARQITSTIEDIKQFSSAVHGGSVKGADGKFENLLLIGIGGSALGPQFVANALGDPRHDKLRPFFFDNTDPDGFDRTLAALEGRLGRTLCIVVSKSGGTKETRNGMLEAKAAYDRAKLDFGKHTVAITSNGSELDRFAAEHEWLKRFPMWDWVGGRTSELSAVGLLPAALQGLDIDGMLAGAHACDILTRRPDLAGNPAALLVFSWFIAGNGRGDKNMILLPYKDRLELLSKYLQQLVMESIGKEFDRNGVAVNQGISVFGNKGSTDQHAYVQQLREGRNDFFVTFVEVLKDRVGPELQVEPDVTSGDYLQGFLLGTRKALFDKERQSLTITVSEVSGFTIGALIALFERSVGLYASLVNINAYHQPGVEAGKKAATDIIATQRRVLKALSQSSSALMISEIAAAAQTDDLESVYKICEHLAANNGRGIIKIAGGTPATAKYQKGQAA